MLGADTRSTAGSVVADKNCEKIHYIAPNIYCCGAGTAADTENVTGTHAEGLVDDVLCHVRLTLQHVQRTKINRHDFICIGVAPLCNWATDAGGDCDDHAQIPSV